jgi:hypothetical protein
MSGLLSVTWLPSIWQTRLQADVIGWIVNRIRRGVQRTPCTTVSRAVRLSEADVTAASVCGSARYMSTRDTSGRSHRPGWRDLGYPLLLVNAALVLVTVSEGVLLSIVPSTAAGIGQLLHISPGSLNWINTVQLLSTGVCTPVCSRLGDIHGHRQVLRAAALLTAAGGVLMAVAPDFSLLLAGRALQGPAGAFTPLAIGILRGRADIGRLRSGTAAVVTGASAGVALGFLGSAQLYRAAGSVRPVQPAAQPAGQPVSHPARCRPCKSRRTGRRCRSQGATAGARP